MKQDSMTDDYRVHFRGFKNGELLAAELAANIASLLASAVEKRGGASLVVSGGSTPVPLFAALSRADIGWDRVSITLADERWVDMADDASNERLVRTHLLRNKAAAARFVGLKTADCLARDGEEECAARIRAVPRPFDVLVLGMGGDGHTASLFPGAVNLPRATDMHSGRLCLAIKPITGNHERMTLTLPALLDARKIILHITGKEKLNVFEQVLAEEPRSTAVLNDMPVRHVLAGAGEAVSVYWAP